MASQPSLQNEERNRLRLQAWEQRNQEASQSDELSPENFPVFGEPYKVHKGDELSSRIRRMLGSYEDVNSPGQFSVEGVPIPTYVTFPQSDQRPPTSDQSTEPPFHCQVPPSSSSTITRSSQPPKMSNMSSPQDVGRLSSSSSSLNQGQGDQLRKSQIPSHLVEMSPDTKPPPLPSHSNERIDTDTKDTLDPQRLQRSRDLLSESLGAAEVSAHNMKRSPKDIAVSQANKPGALPSHTFPPLLSSKQPCVVVTQKPTAYVRPMDGQDEVASESPELKASPEPYVPVTDLIDKADLSRANAKPQSSETRADEAQCVEDILREMTHSWPPLLTALHTPNTQQAPKFLFPVKEAQRVSSRPGQNTRDSSSSSNLKQQPSFNSTSEAAHSSGRETASSSDYESSSGSESDNDGPAEEPLKPLTESQLDSGPALSHHDWQLGNWIRSSHQNVPESPAHQQPPHPQGSKHSGVQVVDPAAASKPRRSSHQKDSAPGVSFPPRRSEKAEDKPRQRGRQKLVSADGGGGSRKVSQTTKTVCPDGAVKSEAPVTSLTKDKPKVKTKPGHGEKVRDKSSTRTEQRTEHSLNGQKASVKSESHVSLGLPAPCPSCPAPSRPPSRTPKHKSKAENRKPHKTNHKHSKQPAAGAAPGPLLVKIDLSLLSRVPQTPTGTPGSAKMVKTVKMEAAAIRGGRVGDASAKHKRTKTSKEQQIPHLDAGDSSVLRKKRKLEHNSTSFSVCVKPQSSNKTSGAVVKKVKKATQQGAALKALDSTSQRGSGETARGRESFKHKNKERPGPKQKTPESNGEAPSRPSGHASTTRPLLGPEDRQHPVRHYIKEAKRLKHKADAESDKLSKAFSYLEAAMFFVESAIAMEKDPQISTSSFTMLAETVELLKFVLKMKNPTDSSSPSEKDFLSLCLRCQSLLQMEMFRHKHKTALKYSKILTEYFETSPPATPNPPKDRSAPATPSPVATATDRGGTAAAVPRAIEQVALGYVDITALVLNAQEAWERAEELAQGGGGLLSELDAVVGRLGLSSLMSSMVRYTRQGVHWLRLDRHKV